MRTLKLSHEASKVGTVYQFLYVPGGDDFSGIDEHKVVDFVWGMAHIQDRQFKFTAKFRR
jgi:hypothetical protein